MHLIIHGSTFLTPVLRLKLSQGGYETVLHTAGSSLHPEMVKGWAERRLRFERGKDLKRPREDFSSSHSSSCHFLHPAIVSKTLVTVARSECSGNSCFFNPQRMPRRPRHPKFEYSRRSINMQITCLVKLTIVVVFPIRLSLKEKQLCQTLNSYSHFMTKPRRMLW